MSLRIPIIYQYKFYPKHSFPISLEVGLTPYWNHYLHFINGKDASYMQLPTKSANELPTFDECFNSFQLDAHLGLQLGERFTIYSRFALRSATKKDNLDKANLISFGINTS